MALSHASKRRLCVLSSSNLCITSKAGKYDLLHHKKGDKHSRPYLFIKDVVSEIISGPEVPRSLQEQKKWSRHVHQILFCKVFAFNEHFASGQSDEEQCSKALMSFKALCRPIPDFHPHMFFELSDEYEWTAFLGELLAVVDLPTSLNFATHSLAFCTPNPSLLYDLSLISTTLDFLLSAVFTEMVNASGTEIQQAKDSSLPERETNYPKDRDQRLFHARFLMSEQQYKDLDKNCLEAAVQKYNLKVAREKMFDSFPVNVEQICDLDEKVREEIVAAASQLMLDKILDQVNQKTHDRIIQLTDLVTEALTLVHKRMSTKLFDRSSCKSSTMSTVLPMLGHILASVIMFCLLSIFNNSSHHLRHCSKSWISRDEDEEQGSTFGESFVGTTQNSSESESSVCGQSNSVSLVAEAFSKLIRTPEMRRTCMKCLSSFFAVQSPKDGLAQKLSSEKSIKFGRVLKLNFQLCKLAKPLKFIRVVQGFSELLTSKCCQEKEGTAAELCKCISSVLTELEKREKVAEEKRLNPSLAEVMEKVQKKLPRWEWCLQYGLAKRDLKDWWFAGFLEFLHRNLCLLGKEQDLRHLLAILQQISQSSPVGGTTENYHQDICSKVITKMFCQLPSSVQQKVLLEVYKDPELSRLQLITDFEQTITVAFNKLSTGSLRKNLGDVLPLALHDLLTFTDHAVNTAISSQGQTPIIVKVLQLIPEAMTSVNPLHHPSNSLLCHCLHGVLHSHHLEAREQRNCLNLVSALVKPFQKDATQHPPLLSPAEFLSSCVLPFITLHTTDPSISTDFALRLLISCLDATHSVGFSDWLEEVHPVVIVACCAGTLQECEELVHEDVDMDWVVTMKSLVLSILDYLLKHFAAGGMSVDGRALSWLQERCAIYDWTVCAYLAPFLVPCDGTESNLLTAGYVAEAVRTATENPSGLLRLSAVSDAAASQVMNAFYDGLRIPYAPLLLSLSQVLARVLVDEAQRVVQVLSALVAAGCVQVDLHPHSLLDGSVTGLAENRTELTVGQLLTDAVVVIVCQESGLSASILHHLSQVLVAALQALKRQHRDMKKEAGKSSIPDVLMFHQVCVLMSVSPDVMLDPLFVLLLDLLTSFTPQESDSGDSLTTRSFQDCLVKGIAMIPRQNLQETLSKKLNQQTGENSVETQENSIE